MIIPPLVEYGTAVSVALDDAAGRALAASKVVEAAPDPFVPGHWRIRAKGTVGVAAVHLPGGGSLDLRITPKVPIGRLLYLLGFSRNGAGWRDEDVQVRPDEDLVPALARLFAMQAETALRQGLLKGYISVDETALVMRGRVRMGEQARRHHGRLVPLELTHDEFTEDIAENRLLRAACASLLRTPGGTPDDVRGRLLRLRARLSEITAVRRGTEIPVWQPSRLNARYHPALRLAEIVLRGSSVESGPGEVTVNGFLFDMARVFEDFVTTALGKSLAPLPGYCRSQARHHLDEQHAIRIIPDFVRYADDGTPLAVADAKYKAEKPAGFPDADLYQMLAYCTALGVSAGHLVYAAGSGSVATHRVRHAGVVIHQHVLDLDQSPDELRRSVDELAGFLHPEIRYLRH
ncbi:5-methylcytosine restriction system specificity protein McrC [Amycolatopsis sp. PS_44_ISF1]|uniref:McrC family protein n=1 Tax=Amycolatopsis sp. PS_44_ISF1 TaxID=2974917 RepID=UPI0028DE81A4|nr:restriction endonuclease [Amycolatopsis sp. PS_44_ISF1]MDT8911269.1 McrC family protein [Amycolatopsis sp. PS_44_ISF1]